MSAENSNGDFSAADTGSMYGCKVCKRHFENQELLTKHESCHLPFTCPICPSSFSLESSLLHHVSRHSQPKFVKIAPKLPATGTLNNPIDTTFRVEHVTYQPNEEVSWCCHICKLCFTTRDQLFQHAEIHFGRLLFPCPLCQYYSETKYRLDNHWKSHIKPNHLECKKCRSSFLRISELKQHTQECNFTAPVLKCQYCPKTFKLERNLSIHVQTHAHDELFPCPVCQISFRSKNLLKTHIKSHQDRFPCDECDLEFQYELTLEYHKASLHHRKMVPIGQRKPNIVSRHFECEICGKKCSGYSIFNKHLATHYPKCNPEEDNTVAEMFNFAVKAEDTTSLFDDDTEPETDPDFICDYCNEKFTKQESMEDHLMMHAGIRTHLCKFCDSVFSFRSNLELHLLAHNLNIY